MFWSILILIVQLIYISEVRPRPIEVTVSPRQAFAPSYVRLIVRVEKNEENRAVCVHLVPMWLNSCWTIDGMSAPVTTQIEYKDIPEGDYEASASVCRGHFEPGGENGPVCFGKWLNSQSYSVTLLGREHFKRRFHF